MRKRIDCTDELLTIRGERRADAPNTFADFVSRTHNRGKRNCVGHAAAVSALRSGYPL